MHPPTRTRRRHIRSQRHSRHRWNPALRREQQRLSSHPNPTINTTTTKLTKAKKNTGKRIYLENGSPRRRHNSRPRNILPSPRNIHHPRSPLPRRPPPSNLFRRPQCADLGRQRISPRLCSSSQYRYRAAPGRRPSLQSPTYAYSRRPGARDNYPCAHTGTSEARVTARSESKFPSEMGVGLCV